MRFPILACWMSLFMVVAVTQAEDKPSKFKAGIPTDAIQFARSVSEDGRAATLIFDNLLVETEIGRSKLPSVATKQFTFVMQLESSKDVCVTQDIRGFLSTTGSGASALMIQSGGATTLVDLKKAVKAAEGPASKTETPTHKQAAKAAKDAGQTGVKPPQGSHDFFQRIETKVSAGKPLQITVVLLADRLPGDDGSGALLTIDSIDLEIHPVPAK